MVCDVFKILLYLNIVREPCLCKVEQYPSTHVQRSLFAYSSNRSRGEQVLHRAVSRKEGCLLTYGQSF